MNAVGLKMGLAATVAAAAVSAVLMTHGSAGTASAAPTSISKTVGNFRLVDQTGFARELYYYRDAKAVVIGAHVLGDKASEQTAKKLAELRQKYDGVEFLMVNSNLADDRQAIAAATASLEIPVLDDELQLVADLLGVRHAGEVVVVDPRSWAVVYRGAVDKAAAKKNADGYLEAALDDIQAGRSVKVAATDGKGASINLPDRARVAEFAKISYAKEVAPILEAKCVDCHSEGGIGPFAMQSYEVVKGFAPMIAETIRSDRMPPWDADPHVGQFSNDKSLTKDEIRTLVRWIEAGAPRGEGADPLAAQRRVAEAWPLGEPDLVLNIPAYDLPAGGYVDYQYPWVSNPLKEAKWLKASTIKAGDRQAVHHILTAASNEVPAQGSGGQNAWQRSVASLGDYAVGAESTIQPENIGVLLPAGGSFAFQMHYTPYGKATTDTSQIGLYFYDEGETPDLMMREAVITDPFISIPAGVAEHRESAYLLFPRDAILYSAFPHAHLRGTYSDLKIQYPDGAIEVLLRLPKYDFNWQRYYDFETPVNVPAGSKIIATYVYDNSTRNPANPDPKTNVLWGDQSFEEMLFTKLRFRWEGETAAAPTDYREELYKTRLLGIMDDNLDGMLQKNELRGPLAQQAGYFDRFDVNKNGALDGAELEQVMQLLGNTGFGRAAAE